MQYLNKYALLWLMPWILLIACGQPGDTQEGRLKAVRDSLTMDLQNIHEQGLINGFSVAFVPKGIWSCK